MPRSPLTEPLLRVQDMIAHVRENLSTDEYMLFLDLLVPQPEPEAKPVKKKRSAKSTKSRRASGMADQLSSRRQVSQSTIDAANDPRTVPDRCGVCGNDEDYADHFKPSPHYHEFDTGKSAASPVAQESTPASSGTGTVDVGDVHHVVTGGAD